MSKRAEEWYHVLPTQDAEAKPQVNANIHTTVFSLQELEEIVLISNRPMAKASYTIKDYGNKIFLKGTYDSADSETYEFALKDLLPLNEMTPYETPEGSFLLEIAIELCGGEVLSIYNNFKCILHKGTTSTEVPRKDLLECLAAIPIAKPGMSIDEVRKICLDFMRLQNEFPFKLNNEYSYVIESQKRVRILRPGIVHSGIPYVTVGAGSLYRVAEYYDPATGMLDTSADIFQSPRVFGNACSGSATISWSRAITSTLSGITPCMSWYNGYLPVGPYRYSKDVDRFVRASVDPDGYDCVDICQENGEQVMFESYACLKPADGVGCNGHVRMNATDPTIVRLPDGSIDGDNSYTYMIEQVCYTSHPNHLRIHPDGSHYTAQGCVDIRYTFRELFETNYIPFTFAEFLGEKEIEIAEAKLTSAKSEDAEVTAAEITAAEWPELNLSSNYPISDVFFSFRDTDGTEIFRHVYRSEDFFVKQMSFAEIFPAEKLPACSGCTLNISCQLYNGERKEVFDGLLVVS